MAVSKPFLRYLLYTNFDVLKISIVSTGLHTDQTGILHKFEISDHAGTLFKHMNLVALS